MAEPIKFRKRYWEVEEPKVVVLGKNVLKLFTEHGKIQVYPKVDSAPNGVGRGATIDLEKMNEKERQQLVKIIKYAVDNFGKN